MSSKEKHKSPCPFASSKKPSKRKKLSNLLDKNRADVLAASDRGSHVEQEKLIALNEEEQSRWENENVCSSWSKIKDKGKDEPAEPESQESLQQLAGQTIFAEFERKFPCCASGGIQILQRIFSARSNIGARFVHVIDMRSIFKVT